MRSVHWTLLGVVCVVVIGSGVAWTSLARVAATEAGQTQVPSAAALHQEAIIVDGHVHITELDYHQGIDPWKVQPTGTFDYARAKQGGLDVVVHAIYPIDGYNMYNYGVKHALRLLETFYRRLEANQDKMELALTSADVRRIVGKGKMAAILALEGNPDMEGDLDVLRMWYRLGVRMIEFTSHQSTNAMVDAENDEHLHSGLSAHGRAVIREMNRLGMIVDIAHASEEAAFQIIAASQAPVAASHRALGTLSPELIKALAAKGGLLAMHSNAGAEFSKPLQDWRRAQPSNGRSGRSSDASGTIVSRARRSTLRLPNEGIRPPEDRGAYIAALDAEVRDEKLRQSTPAARGDGYGTPWRELQQKDLDAGMPKPTAADWAEHAAAVVKLIGDDHVGIGLDLMANPFMRDFDATQYPRFTEAMLEKGLSPATIKKVLGENWLRLLDQAKVPGLEPPAPTAPAR